MFFFSKLFTNDITVASEVLKYSDCQHVYNYNGVRWLFCRKCGRVSLADDFKCYGGKGIFMNSGICNSCFEEDI